MKINPTIAIFTLALILRAFFFLGVELRSDGMENRFISPDVFEYHHIANNLDQNGVFSDSPIAPYNPRLERTPLYPLFLAGIYRMADPNAPLAIIIQILLSSFTCVLTYWIGRAWFSERIAKIAAIILAIDYTGILYSNTYYSETLFTAFFLLHLYLLTIYLKDDQPHRGKQSAVSPTGVNGQQSDKKGHPSATLRVQGIQKPSFINKLFSFFFFLFSSIFHRLSLIFNLKVHSLPTSNFQPPTLLFSGIFLAAATLTRPISVYWIIFLIPILFWQGKDQLQKATLHFFLLTITFSLLLTPWAIRYYDHTGKWLISSQQEEILWWNIHNLHKLYSVDNRQWSIANGLWKVAKNETPSLNDSTTQLRNHINKSTHSTIISIPVSLQNALQDPTFQAVKKDIWHYAKGVINFFTVISSSDIFRMLGLDFHAVGDESYRSTRFAFLDTIRQQKSAAELIVIGLLGLYLVLLYMMAAAGLFKLIRQKQYFAVSFCALITLYFLLASAPAAFTAKYRMPVLPVIALFAAASICYHPKKQTSPDNRQQFSGKQAPLSAQQTARQKLTVEPVHATPATAPEQHETRQRLTILPLSAFF